MNTLMFLLLGTIVTGMFFPMFLPMMFIAWPFFITLIAFMAFGYTQFCLPMLPTCLADDLFEYIFRPFVTGDSSWLSSFFDLNMPLLPNKLIMTLRCFIRCGAEPYCFYDGVNSVIFFLQWSSPATFLQIQNGEGIWSWARSIPIINETVVLYEDYYEKSPEEQARHVACFSVTILLASLFIIVLSVLYKNANYERNGLGGKRTVNERILRACMHVEKQVVGN